MPPEEKKDEQKTERFNMFMSPSEMKAIDDWAWENRIRSKSEAVRRLCQIALQVEEQSIRATKLAMDLTAAYQRVESLAKDPPETAEDEVDFFVAWIDELLPLSMELAASTDAIGGIIEALRSGEEIESAMERVENKKQELEKTTEMIERLMKRNTR